MKMLIINKTLPETKPRTVNDVAIGEVFWAPEIGTCIMTAVTIINIHDWKPRVIDGNVLIKECEASLTFQIK